jgi:hypothetical protein
MHVRSSGIRQINIVVSRDTLELGSIRCHTAPLGTQTFSGRISQIDVMMRENMTKFGLNRCDASPLSLHFSQDSSMINFYIFKSGHALKLNTMKAGRVAFLSDFIFDAMFSQIERNLMGRFVIFLSRIKNG